MPRIRPGGWLILLAALFCCVALPVAAADPAGCFATGGCGHGVVAVSPPALSDGQVAPYSLDLSGNQRGTAVPGRLAPLGYQQITSLSAATALPVPTGATVAYIQVSGAAIRYRDDGIAPTASVGMPVPVGSMLTYSGSLAAIQFIQQTAGAVLDVSYYK
jgi:hypothetical protein